MNGQSQKSILGANPTTNMHRISPVMFDEPCVGITMDKNNWKKLVLGCFAGMEAPFGIHPNDEKTHESVSVCKSKFSGFHNKMDIICCVVA